MKLQGYGSEGGGQELLRPCSQRSFTEQAASSWGFFSKAGARFKAGKENCLEKALFAPHALAEGDLSARLCSDKTGQLPLHQRARGHWLQQSPCVLRTLLAHPSCTQLLQPSQLSSWDSPQTRDSSQQH